MRDGGELRNFFKQLVGIPAIVGTLLGLYGVMVQVDWARGFGAGSLAGLLVVVVNYRYLQKKKKKFTIFAAMYIMLCVFWAILLWLSFHKSLPFFIGCVLGLLQLKFVTALVFCREVGCAQHGKC